MGNLLELLGKGLEKDLLHLVLPNSIPLSASDIRRLTDEVRENPDHAGNILRLGIHYAQSGSAEKAEGAFRSILGQERKNLDALLAWAGLYAGGGCLAEAVNKLNEAHKIQEQDPRILYGLGYCCERAGKIGPAREYYTLGTKCPSYLRQNWQRLAALALVAGDYNLAIEFCRRLQQEHPEEVWYYQILGQLYLQTSAFEKAAEMFERALTIEPDNFELRDDEIEELAQAGRIREAIERMQQLISTQGEFADSYVRLGDLFSQLGEDESARESYHYALRLHQGYLEAAVKLGTQHLRMARFFEAAGSFNRAVEINDQIIAAYVGLGISEILAGKPEQGNDTLSLAMALQPNTNLLFAETARLQLKVAQKVQAGPDSTPGLDIEELGNKFLPGKFPPDEMDKLLKKQIERHQRSLERQPNDAGLNYRAAILLWGKGRGEEAAQRLRQAVTIHPGFARARVKLGLALRELGRQDEAREQLQQSLFFAPGMIELHYKLAVLFCDPIQFALAMENCSLEPALGADANVESNLRLALENMGLIDPAQATWQALCELEPQSRMAWQAQRTNMTLKVFQQ